MKTIGAQSADTKLQGMKGDQAKDQIKTQGDVDLSKIGATGSEERKTMNEQNRMEAKTAARQHKLCTWIGRNVLMTTTTAKGGKVYLTFVDEWLDTLPASESEEFREFADVTPSIIEIWVYAGILNYPGTFNDLARWVKMKFKKLDRRGILNSEISALHSDIQELRMAVTSGEIKGDNGAARLAALEKELRSHIEVSERINKSTDKRGLILAGADRVMRELTAIFKDDPQFSEPIENAMNAVWAKVYSEVSN